MRRLSVPEPPAALDGSVSVHFTQSTREIERQSTRIFALQLSPKNGVRAELLSSVWHCHEQTNKDKAADCNEAHTTDPSP